MPSWLARVLAALVAVGLVAGAFVARGAISGDDEVSAGGSGGGSGGSSDGDRRVLCDADLGEDVCDAVAAEDGVDEVVVASLGEVLDAAASPPGEGELDLTTVDAWLTLDPMPEVLDVARRTASQPMLAISEAVPVASSPLVVLTFPDSELACAGARTADWSCLTEELRPEVAVPSGSTSLGTIVVGAAGAALADDSSGPDVGIGAFQGTEEGDLLRALVERSPAAAGSTSADQASAMISPGTASGAVTVDALGSITASTSAGQGRGLTTVAVEPAVTVGVVVVEFGEGGSDVAADLAVTATGDDGVAEALVDAGWELGTARSEGLLAPDVVYALREEVA